MELTPEQKERIRVNRERAIEIKRKREQAEEILAKQQKLYKGGGNEEDNSTKRQKFDNKSEQNGTKNNNEMGNKKEEVVVKETKDEKKKGEKKKGDEEEDDETLIQLEQFEETASEYVTKAEAKKMYCLPEGTLAVCDYVEKPNPHNSNWTPMKMYNRAEIRRYARKRYGGLQGLVKERNQREARKFAKDMEHSNQLFSTSSSSSTTTTTTTKKKKKQW